MITLTRLLLRRWHSVLKRAFRLTPRGPVPDLHLTAGPTGLVLRASAADLFVEYQLSESQPVQQIFLPLAVIADLQGGRREPVSLDVVNPGVLEARWQDQGVSYVRQYPLPPSPPGEFPPLPETLVANPLALINAFREAFATTDVTASRYALGCVQIRGARGMLAATNGHHLLQQGGFQFGFDQEVLLRPTRLFECPELAEAAAVQVGRLEKHLVLQAGEWKLWLPLETEGRFPKTDDILFTPESAKTRLELSTVDAEFLADNVSRLPIVEPNHDVTLDLNGSVVVRGKSESTPLPTELVLRSSTKNGADLQIASDRRFLVRAAKLGLRQFYLRAADQTILAQDETRSYVWMPLVVKSCIASTPDCLRIESPGGARSRSSYSPTPQPTMTTPPTTTTLETTTPVKPIRRQSRSPNKPAGAMEQATVLREQLRTLLTASKELIRTLKTEHRSRKSLKLALDSLKQLQAA